VTRPLPPLPGMNLPAVDDLLGLLPAGLGADRQRLWAIVDRARRRLSGGAATMATGPAGTVPRPAASRPPEGSAGRIARTPGPPRPVRLRLPDGRTVPVALDPPLATRKQVAAAQRRASHEHAKHQRSIDQLARAQEALAARVNELEAQGDLALVGMLRGLAGMRQRLEAAAVVQTRALVAQRRSVTALVARQGRRVRGQLRAQGRASQIQKVNAAASSLQSAAYGQKGELLSRNNLLLAGNQLLWGFIDPILRGLGLWSGAAPSPVAWVSPLASLIIGGLAIGPAPADPKEGRG
jgi:hypothetical protein